MKSRERIQRDRDKIKNLYVMILMSLIFLTLIILLWMGVSETGLEIFLIRAKSIIAGIWEEIVFKFETFFNFSL